MKDLFVGQSGDIPFSMTHDVEKSKIKWQKSNISIDKLSKLWYSKSEGGERDGGSC